MIRNHYFLTVLLCGLGFLPFVNKAVTYDDAIFLDYAKRLTKDPARCAVSDYVFQGQVLKDFVVFESTHPPLVPYYLKIAMYFLGERIALLHLAFLPFWLLAALALGDLVRRYCGRSPIWAAGLLLGPLFLPCATWLMADMPLLAFWLAAVAAWERGLDPPSGFNRWSLLAAMSCFCAAFTAYQGLGLLPLLLIHGYARRQFKTALWTVCLTAAPLLLWLSLVWARYQLIPFFTVPREELSIAGEVAKGMGWENILLKARLLPLYVGVGFTVMLLPAAIESGRRRLFLVPALLGWGWALAVSLAPEADMGRHLWFWLAVSAGLFALPLFGGAIKNLWHEPSLRPTFLMLAVWLLGFAGFQTLVAAYAAPRYVMPMMAPLFLLLLRALPGGVVRATAWAAGLNAVLGLAVAFSEFEYAQAQRIDRLDLPQTSGLFFAGEKGMKYYGERAGYRYYRPGLEDRVGYLLVPREIDHIPISEALLKYAEARGNFVRRGATPLKVMNRKANAGFYIHTRGLLPYTLSSEPIEEFTLYQCYHQANPHWIDGGELVPKSVGDILPDRPVSQDFHCRMDGLTALVVNLATNRRTNPSTLVIELLDVTGNGDPLPVFRTEIDARTLKDNHWHRYDFEPLLSAGKDFRLRLSSPDATPATSVTIWANTSAPGSYLAGTEEHAGRLGFVALCSPRRDDGESR